MQTLISFAKKKEYTKRTESVTPMNEQIKECVARNIGMANSKSFVRSSNNFIDPAPTSGNAGHYLRDAYDISKDKGSKLSGNRPTTASRVAKSIADQGGMLLDGCHPDNKFREINPQKWVNSKDF